MKGAISKSGTQITFDSWRKFLVYLLYCTFTSHRMCLLLRWRPGGGEGRGS